MRRLLIAAALLAPMTARAAVDSQSVECPVDGTAVAVTIILSSNALLGHDRDLCPHASEASSDEISNSVSACPVCGFAGTPPEFHGEIPAELAARVKGTLAPSAALSAGERYANRAQIQEWAKAPEAAIGESWLRAAWSVRLDPRSAGDPALREAATRLLGDAPAPGTQGKPAGAQTGAQVLAGDPILDPARTLDAAALKASGSDRAVALYSAGALFRSRGELDAAETRYAKAIDAAKDTPVAAAIAAVVARDRESIDLERQYLTRAVAHFKLALAAPKIPAHQKALLAFLAAESARRTGARDDAAKLYKQSGAVKDPAADSGMKALIEQGLADVKSGVPVKKAK